MASQRKRPDRIRKTPTGIPGLDAMTAGGLPMLAVTLVVGAAGAGKTVLALQVLAAAARERSDPGIFVAFEEPAKRILANAASFGWGLPELMRRRLLLIDARLPEDAVQSGNFDISGLLATVEAHARAMKARWVVFDALDILLDLLPDATLRRREVQRLQAWLQGSGLTGILTAKLDSFYPGQAPAHLYLGYMAECVIQLERIRHGEATSHWLTIEKYRGSPHVQRAVPYLIGEGGLEIEAMDECSGGHAVFRERISTGVPRLDTMLGGGLFRASATLVTGAPGTAKTTLAGKLAETACRRGERVLYVCFDESGEEIVRNLSSVGVRLEPHVRAGRLRLLGLASRASSAEALHAAVWHEVSRSRPQLLVLDPLSALLKQGEDTVAMDIAYLGVQRCKRLGITLFATSLAQKSVVDVESSELHVSTLADTWIHLNYLVRAGERNRLLTIVKSRGSGHSNQVRELVLSDGGITLADVYVEEGEVLLGTLRHQREAAMHRQREKEAESGRRERQDRRRELQDLAERIRTQQADLTRLRGDLAADDAQSQRDALASARQRRQTRLLRGADVPAPRRKRR